MAKTFRWRRYFVKRTEVFGLHWFRQISYPVIIIAGLVVIYSIIKPEAATVINISFWGSFFVVSFGVFLFIFIFSLPSWGRKILCKMPWEVEYRRRDKEAKELKRRLGKVETRLDGIEARLSSIEMNLGNLVGDKKNGRGQSNTKTKTKETKGKK